MQISIECHAYACDWQDLEKILSGKDTPMLTCCGPELLSEGDTYLGTAVLSFDVGPKDQIAAKQIDRLQSILQTVRAENQQRENAILDRISKLQSIAYEPA